MADTNYAHATGDHNPICNACGEPVPRCDGEPLWRWLRRKRCSEACLSAKKLPKPPLARIRAKVDCAPGLGPNGECHEWTGHRDPKGYGKMNFGGPGKLVHRVMYSLVVGDPGDMLVCHTCDNPPCCNPAHLFLGTNQDNMDDMNAKGRAIHPAGDEHANSKIADADVRGIRESTESSSALARKFGVSASLIAQIRKRKSRKAIP